MLAADPDLELGAHAAAVFDSDTDEAADSAAVENLKRIVGKNTTIDI